MGITRYNQVQADQFLGSQAEASPFGKIWYVDGTNGSDGNSGDGPNAGEALATIGQAITNAVATRGDTVVIYPGTYTITSALSPKAGMTFKAAIVNPQAPSVSIRGNIASLLTLDVNNCRFIGLEFRATGSTNRQLVRIANSASVTAGTFEDCVFHGADQTSGLVTAQGVVGIKANHATNTTTALVIRRCLFRDLGKTQVEIGVQGIPYAKIEDNTFAIDTPTGIGLFLDDTAAFATGKGYVIRNNEFIGEDTTTSTSIGIVLQGTKNTTGAGMFRNNFFAYCSNTPVTQDKLSGAFAENYVANSAGGLRVDPTAT